MPAIVVLALCLSALVPPAVAHDFTFTTALMAVRPDGRFQVDVICDLDALATGLPPGSGSQGHDGVELAARIASLPAAERAVLAQRLNRMFRTRIKVRFDGEVVPVSVSFPESEADFDWETAAGVVVDRAGEEGQAMSVMPNSVGSGDEDDLETGTVDVGVAADTPATFFGVAARLSGVIPEASESFSFSASRAFRTVHLTVVQPGSTAVERFVLGLGEESEALELLVPASSDLAAVGDLTTREGTRPSVSGRGFWPTFFDYVRLGFLHIVPRGLDHVAFILALCLVSTRLTTLAWLVSAFTLGHTISLGLASKGLLAAAPALIEPMIALSIAWVAVAALWRSSKIGWNDKGGEGGARGGVAATRTDGKASLPKEAFLVLGLGLLHGLGFAGVLGQLGLPAEQWWTGLIGFNLGVEFGQLVVLLVGVVLLAGAARALGPSRSRQVVGASLVVASGYFLLGALGLLGG